MYNALTEFPKKVQWITKNSTSNQVFKTKQYILSLANTTFKTSLHTMSFSNGKSTNILKPNWKKIGNPKKVLWNIVCFFLPHSEIWQPRSDIGLGTWVWYLCTSILGVLRTVGAWYILFVVPMLHYSLSRTDIFNLWFQSQIRLFRPSFVALCVFGVSVKVFWWSSDLVLN